MQQRFWKARLYAACAALLIAAGQAVSAAAGSVAEEAVDEAAPAYEALPMSFEPNVGQTDEPVAFLARGRGYTVFLTPDEAVLALGRRAGKAPPDAARGGRGRAAARHDERAPSVLRMRFPGAGGAARVVGLEPLPGRSNYLIGDDPSRWRTDVPTYARVRYEGLYDGVDLELYGNQQHLEYDFRVAPGADASQVRVQFDGAELVEVDESGALVLRMRDGEIRHERARVYQEGEAGKQDVPVRYSVTAGGEVVFELGAYDASRTLVIDPVLVYSTYLGGSSDDAGTAIAVDASGAAYVTGFTGTASFPTVNPIEMPGTSLSSTPVNAFVAKLNAAGSALVYSTYLGGSNYDEGTGIAVDGAGAVYVAGYTSSTNFPTAGQPAGPFQPTYGGGSYDAFLTKLNAAGSALVYSSYLGGAASDVGQGIAVDGAGAAYVTGYTSSGDFPTVNPIEIPGTSLTSTPVNAFVTKVDAAGASLVYSTCIGGSGWDEGMGIAVDSGGAAYVTGHTSSTNFPTAGPSAPSSKSALPGPPPSPIQPANAGAVDAFVTKLDATGAALAYSTYLGGAADDAGHAIAVDGTGAAYVTGSTGSTNFPTANPFQVVHGGSAHDAFVTKVNADGAALVYSTYLGGSLGDVAYGVAVDGTGAAYVTGTTHSTNFPTASPIQPANAGQFDVFVAKVSAAGASLTYSTYLGGSTSPTHSASEAGYGIAVDGSGAAYVTGYTVSTNFPTASQSASPLQPALAGGRDAFVVKLPRCTDTLELSASSYSVGEGEAAIVIVTRSGSCGGTVSVAYATSDGTATAGVDYTPASGTLTFPAGTTAKAFTVQTIGDGVAQGNRSLDVTLGAPSAGAVLGAVTQAPLTIVDDDAAGTLEFASATLDVAENVVSQTATITLVRVNGGAGAVTVEYDTADNTATADRGGDYGATSGTLTLEDGVTSATFTVPIFDDALAEGNESLHLTLRGPTGGAVLGARSRALLTIADDDVRRGGFAFSAPSYDVDEGGAARIVITRASAGTAQSVTFSTSDNGTAQAGADYTAVTRTVRFAAGVRQVVVVVATTADRAREGDESVNLTLANPTGGAVLGAARRAVLVVADGG